MYMYIHCIYIPENSSTELVRTSHHSFSEDRLLSSYTSGLQRAVLSPARLHPVVSAYRLVISAARNQVIFG